MRDEIQIGARFFKQETKMKKTAYFIVIVFAVSCPGVFAEEFSRIGLGAGISLLDIEPGTISDFDCEFDKAPMGDARLTFHITRSISFQLLGAYAKTEMRVMHDSKSGDFGELTQIPVRLTGRYRFSVSKTDLYVNLGLGCGYYFNEFDSDTREELDEFFALNLSADAKDSIGYHVNVGLEYYFTGNYAATLDFSAIFNKAEFELHWPGGETETKDVSLNASVFSGGFNFYF